MTEYDHSVKAALQPRGIKKALTSWPLSIVSTRMVARTLRSASLRAGALASLILLAACGDDDDGMAPAPAAQIFHGGAIVTVDPRRPEVEALAVGSDGTIVALGSQTEVLRHPRPGDRAHRPPGSHPDAGPG
jgi:hypothetical protein